MIAPLFKEDSLEKEWEDDRLYPSLRWIMFEFIVEAMSYGWIPLITSIFRVHENDSGMHEMWRAIDIRTFDVKDEVRRKVVEAINTRWIYDPQRPNLVVAYDKPHGTGPHVHLQVHPRTKLRKNI